MRLAKWTMIFLVLVLSLSTALVGCSSSAPAPTTAPAPAQTSAAPKPTAPAATSATTAAATTAATSAATTAATSAAAKPVDNTALIEAAKKEGSLNWLDGVVDAGSAKKMIPAFKKKYGLPDSFEVKHEQLGTGPLSSRIQEEVKAGKITIDVFAIADPVLMYDLKNANALLQYESPEYKNYSKSQKAGLTYEPGYWQSAIAYCFAPITNPKFYAKPITSWTDLLAPDLKGNKIEWGTPASSQSQLYAYIALKNVLPPTYFADVAKQQITSGTSSQQQTANIAQGQNLVTITNPFRIVQTSAQTGIELKAWFPKEGVPLMGHPYGIMAKAAHPNASKLFIDWLYSEDGMTMYRDLVAPIMLRDGMTVPDSIKAYSPPIEDIKAAPIDWKSLNAAGLDKERKASIEIFGK